MPGLLELERERFGGATEEGLADRVRQADAEDADVGREEFGLDDGELLNRAERQPITAV